MSQFNSKQKYLGILNKRYQLSETDKVQEEKQKKVGIEVLCRIRPRFINESYVQYQLKPEFFRNDIEIFETKSQGQKQEPCNSKKFRFTKVFDQDTSQQQVLDAYVSKLLMEMFEQKKCGLIFSYGVTNSGKTYTIVGNEQNPGLLPLTLECLMKMKQAVRNGQDKYKIGDRSIQLQTDQNHKLIDINVLFQSYEIYNEEIFDLLHDRRFNKDRLKLQIKESGERKFIVKDALERHIQDTNDIEKILQLCLSNRQMGETNLNNSSSRSHTIFKIYVKFLYTYQQFMHTLRNNIQLESSLCIVDLAGSERAKKADTQGIQLNEACNINKSLLVLGRCLKQMKHQDQETNQVVPFRECKLTRVLCEYFTEENNILMIVNIKLTIDDLEETLKVLHYGAMGVHINLLKSKVLDSTLSFQQRLQIQKDKSDQQLGVKQELSDDQEIVNNLDYGQCVKTIQIFENIRYICRINQEIMEAEHDEQIEKVKKFSNQFQNGLILIKKVNPHSSKNKSMNQQIQQLPNEQQDLSDQLNCLTIEDQQVFQHKNINEENKVLLECFQQISLVEQAQHIDPLNNNQLDSNIEIQESAQQNESLLYQSMLALDVITLDGSMSEQILVVDVSTTDRILEKIETFIKTETPSFDENGRRGYYSFGSEKIEPLEIQHSSLNISGTQKCLTQKNQELVEILGQSLQIQEQSFKIQLNQEIQEVHQELPQDGDKNNDVNNKNNQQNLQKNNLAQTVHKNQQNQEEISSQDNESNILMIENGPPIKEQIIKQIENSSIKNKFAQGPTSSIFKSLTNFQDELSQDRSDFMKKALASVKSKSKFQEFNAIDFENENMNKNTVNEEISVSNFDVSEVGTKQFKKRKVKKGKKR